MEFILHTDHHTESFPHLTSQELEADRLFIPSYLHWPPLRVRLRLLAGILGVPGLYVEVDFGEVWGR